MTSEGGGGIVLIRAEGVSKKFCRNLERSLRYGFQDVFHELTGRHRRAELRPGEFWSLKDVSFELHKGESVALLGRNGAGKSTLLQLLTGRLKLDEGRILVRATTGLVTELGAGFNPVQTGRENVYNSGAVLGMSAEQVDAVYGDIVAFAELQDAMETPVQTYSSGMRARLGYAVVAHLRPDVLIGDEVLATGDIAFRRKCLQHMVRYVRRGGTVIVVAHDMYALQSICTRCILLDGGRLIYDGPAVDGFKQYYELMKEPASTAVEPQVAGAVARTEAEARGPNGPGEAPEAAGAAEAPGPDLGPREEPSETHPIVIDHVSIRGADGREPQSSGDAVVELRYRALHPFDAVIWGFSIHTPDRALRIATGMAGIQEQRFPPLRKGEGALRCRISKLPLAAGRYALTAGVLDVESRAAIAEFGREGPAAVFTVKAEASELNNLRAYLGNLVVLDVGWDIP